MNATSEGKWDNRCLKSGDRLELNTKKPGRGMDRGTEREKDRASGWSANELEVQAEMSDESEAFWEDAPV